MDDDYHSKLNYDIIGKYLHKFLLLKGPIIFFTL